MSLGKALVVLLGAFVLTTIEVIDQHWQAFKYQEFYTDKRGIRRRRFRSYADYCSWSLEHYRRTRDFNGYLQ